MDYARIVSKLREQIIKFSGELSFGWPKVARRFIAEVVYGIQARQSVRLTEIARSLEERIPLRKTGNGKLNYHDGRKCPYRRDGEKVLDIYK